MPIPCIQEFASFFCRNVCEFLRPLLLISEPLNTVLQRLVLHHLVLEHLLLLHHLVAHHQAVLDDLCMASIVEGCVTVSGRHSDQALLMHRGTHYVSHANIVRVLSQSHHRSNLHRPLDMISSGG